MDRLEGSRSGVRARIVNVTIVMGPWLPVPPLRGGAMPKVWHGLAQEFSRLGHRVSTLARKFPGQPDEERSGDVHIIRTLGFAQGGSIARDIAKDFVYAANLLLRLPRADILVTNDFWVPTLAAAFRRGAGAVVVCAARYPKGQYWLYRRAARIVAISTTVRTAIIGEEPTLAQRTVVIPLPVDVDVFSGHRPSRTSRKRTLLYVGRVHPEKGIELLLRAFALVANRFPDWRLKIVGPMAEADGGGGQRFEHTMRGLAQGLDVEFGGPVFDAAALATEYSRADLFCYPSLADRGEAFGLAPLEAMAAGVPPIVSALECFRDYIADGENGWVFDHHAGDSKARLAEVLARAMNDDGARMRMSRRARLDARRFTYAVVAQRYLDEFQKIVAAR